MLPKKGTHKNHHQWMLNPRENSDEDEDYFLHSHKVSFTHCLFLQVCVCRGGTNQFYSGNTEQHLDGSSKLISLMIDIMCLQMLYPEKDATLFTHGFA